MGFAAIKEHAFELFNQAPFISHISNEADYAQALALMEELIEDYDNQQPLIDVLSASIARWEDKSPEFKSFNDRIEKLDSGIATFKVIMEQHKLGVADLRFHVHHFGQDAKRATCILNFSSLEYTQYCTHGRF